MISMDAFLTLNGLRTFKNKQDQFNSSKFATLTGGENVADKAVNDANGNEISETYATKDELGTVATKAATKSALGVVQVGDNISVSEGGVLSISADNIKNALNYTPLDSNDLNPIPTEDIEGLFNS